MHSLSIRRFMTPDPVTVYDDVPLHRALELLIERDLSALPVVDRNRAVVGLLNERHILKVVGDSDARTIRSVMDPPPVTIDIGQLLVEAVDALMSINVRQVIMLDNSRVVGVVTRADLMPAVFETLLQRQAARPRAWSCVRH
jgi:CBS domain-containing protein